jgi:hypothetical protein
VTTRLHVDVMSETLSFSLPLRNGLCHTHAQILHSFFLNVDATQLYHFDGALNKQMHTEQCALAQR